MPTRPVADIEQPRHARARRLPPRTAAAVVLAAVAAWAAAALLARWLDDATLGLRAAVLATGGGGILLAAAARHLHAPAFGAANAATLARAGLTVLLAALLATAPSPALGWTLVGLGAAALALDGLDGALARRRNEASEFGARFDMEVDALLILVLAGLVWQHGKAGAWILAAGLLRYAFVAASRIAPWLGAALPPSRRRQAVCVVQIVALLCALVPLVVQPWSAALSLAGLAALAWSFAADVHWLARHARS